jgi:hypothetical protein
VRATASKETAADRERLIGYAIRLVHEGVLGRKQPATPD